MFGLFWHADYSRIINSISVYNGLARSYRKNMKHLALFLPVLTLVACQKNIDPTTNPLVIPNGATQTPPTAHS